MQLPVTLAPAPSRSRFPHEPFGRASRHSISGDGGTESARGCVRVGRGKLTSSHGSRSASGKLCSPPTSQAHPVVNRRRRVAGVKGGGGGEWRGGGEEGRRGSGEV